MWILGWEKFLFTGTCPESLCERLVLLGPALQLRLRQCQVISPRWGRVPTSTRNAAASGIAAPQAQVSEASDGRGSKSFRPRCSTQQLPSTGARAVRMSVSRAHHRTSGLPGVAAKHSTPCPNSMHNAINQVFLLTIQVQAEAQLLSVVGANM